MKDRVRKHYIQMAKDLGYNKKVIEMLEKAESENDAANIMADARANEMYEE